MLWKLMFVTLEWFIHSFFFFVSYKSVECGLKLVLKVKYYFETLYDVLVSYPSHILWAFETNQFACFFTEITCPVPNIPANGRIALGLISYAYAIDTTVQFVCNSGYQLNGSPTVTCLSSTEWSANNTTCDGKCRFRCGKTHLNWSLKQVYYYRI